MKKVNKIKLTIIKNQTIKLRGKYQLPYKLCYYIYNLTDKDSEVYVRFLIELTNHYLRVKNYYKKYQDLEKAYNEDIQKRVSEFIDSNVS